MFTELTPVLLLLSMLCFHKCECFVVYGYLSYNDLLRNTLNSYRLNKASTISLYGLSFMDAVLCDFFLNF